MYDPSRSHLIDEEHESRCVGFAFAFVDHIPAAAIVKSKTAKTGLNTKRTFDFSICIAPCSRFVPFMIGEQYQSTNSYADGTQVPIHLRCAYLLTSLTSGRLFVVFFPANLAKYCGACAFSGDSQIVACNPETTVRASHYDRPHPM